MVLMEPFAGAQFFRQLAGRLVRRIADHEQADDPAGHARYTALLQQQSHIFDNVLLLKPPRFAFHRLPPAPLPFNKSRELYH